VLSIPWTATSAVARAYRREVTRRPGYLGLLATALALLLVARTFDLFGFGQERNLVTQQMLETIALTLSIVVLLFGAGAIGRDLENRSALLFLAKPLGRGAFLLGRFLGLAQCCLIAAAPLLVASIVVLGHGESSKPVSAAEARTLAEGVLVALGQAAALAAFVLLLSTALPSPVVLAVAIGGAALGLIVEPLRASLDPGASVFLHGAVRVVGLVVPPLHEPAAATTVAFDGGLSAPALLVRLARSLVYAVAALAAATFALGRKDLT